MKHILSLPLLVATLSGCATQAAPLPTMMHVDYTSPAKLAESAEMAEQGETASIWSTSPNALLSMRRAKQVGDLLTVVVEMNDKASLQNSLTRSRSQSEDYSVDALFGLPEWANGVLPGGASISPGIDSDRSSSLNGTGAVNRAEKVTFRLATRVVGVEPNGNLIIEGYQETRVSNEIRYLTVSGVIRSQDVTRMNTVSYDKIADARLSYVSSGEAIGPTSRGAFYKLFDNVNPF
jgi:flagellar L-ring protein FlgH